MNLPIRSVLITRIELRNFLKNNYKGFHTKDYELLIGLFLAWVNFKEFRKEYLIGFPAKRDIERELLKNRSAENITLALRSCLYEDSEIDLILVPEDQVVDIQKDVGKASGEFYQLKRFGFNTGKSKDITNDLLDYLKIKIPKKYPTSDKGNFVVVIGGGKGDGSFDIKYIKENFTPIDYPFKRVKFVTGDDDFMKYGEIWPKSSTGKYNISLIFD